MSWDIVLLALKGLVIGLVVAAPVGPIGLLCIRRTLEHRVGVGLATGAGAALADSLFGCIAAFGLTWVQRALEEHEHALQLVGGVALIGIAAYSLRRRHEPPPLELRERPIDQRSLVRGFLTGLGLTLTNPVTIMGFVFTFASFGAAQQLSAAPKLGFVLILGVFAGSMLWWTILCGAVMLVRGRMSPRLYANIDRVAAAAIGLIGLGSLVDFALDYLR